MSNLPLALIGVAAVLIASKGETSVASLVGFVTLLGIATRNGILLMRHYNHLMIEENMPFGRDLIIRGAVERLSPIAAIFLFRSASCIYHVQVQLTMHDLHMTVRIHHASADDAGEVHRILHEAFAEYGHGVTPPTYLLDETVEDVRKLMMAGGALLGYLDDVAVGAARYQIRIDHLHAERVAVLPEYRRRGVSTAMMAELEDVTRKAGLPEIRLGLRASIPSNLRLFENLGYRAFKSVPHPRGPDWVIWMRKPVT